MLEQVDDRAGAVLELGDAVVGQRPSGAEIEGDPEDGQDEQRGQATPRDQAQTDVADQPRVTARSLEVG